MWYAVLKLSQLPHTPPPLRNLPQSSSETYTGSALSCCLHRCLLIRMRLAAVRFVRALEFNAWLDKCHHRRSMMHLLVNSVICLTIACLTYSNLVFAARFDLATCTDWLTTCVIALLVESTLQQPVVLLMTGVIGDYAEEGADFLLEVLES